MALEINETGRPQNSQMADALKQAQAKPQNQRQSNAGAGARGHATGSIFDMNTSANILMSRNTMDAALHDFRKSVDEVIANEPKLANNQDIKVYGTDAHENNIPFGILSLCYRTQTNGRETVLVYNWVVAASGEPLPPRVINIRNQEIEVYSVPGDSYTPVVWETVKRRIATEYSPNAIISDVGMCVIEAEVPVKETERVRPIVQNGVAALANNANRLSANPEVVTPAMFEDGTALVARLDFTHDSDTTTTGMPVRASAVITASAIGPRDNGHNTLHKSTRLSASSVFINLVYVGQEQAQPTGYGYQPTPVTQSFMPQVVITSTDPMTNFISEELQLLAISSTTLLNNGNSWANAFRPRHGLKGEVDLNDIGAIGREISFNPNDPEDRKPVNTKVDDFQLMPFLAATVRPELIYSMDIPEAGDLTWFQSMFTAAAEGSQPANQAIIRTADNLTGGEFSKLWKGSGESIMIPIVNRVHLGYYSPQGGGPDRDIREIDYLALMNMCGHNDLRTVIDWCDTFDNVQEEEELRLEKRLNILRTYLSGSMKITGYARRVTFNPHFLLTLTAALNAAGLCFIPDNVQTIAGVHQRGNPLARQWGMAANTPGFFRDHKGYNDPTGYRPPLGPRNNWFNN